MSRGGFPGGFGGINMNQIMKQAKKMQEDVTKTQENLANKTYESTTGGGAVYVKINGEKKIQELKIKKEVVDPADVEMLQDLIISAINGATDQADQDAAKELGKYNIPGLNL